MFTLNPTEPQFFATIRYLWYTLRRDTPTAGWFNLMWSLWTVPLGQHGAFNCPGFGKDWDLVVANIHDTAGANLR